MAPGSSSIGIVRALLLAGAVLAGSDAHALTIKFECTGHRVMTAEFTPREAHVHFEGADWTLVRVRDAREAHFVSTRAGVELETKDGTMNLTHDNETLLCLRRDDSWVPTHAPEKPAPATSAAAAQK